MHRWGPCGPQRLHKTSFGRMFPSIRAMAQVDWRFSVAYLTYSQVDYVDASNTITDHVGAFVSLLQATYDQLGASHHLVAHELHGNGGHHYHTVVRFPNPVRTRDPRFFDVAGFHPNYRGLRGAANVGRVLDYCRKDGDFFGPDGDDDFTGAGSHVVGRERDDVWHQILGAGCEDEFWELCRSPSSRGKDVYRTQPLPRSAGPLGA